MAVMPKKPPPKPADASAGEDAEQESLQASELDETTHAEFRLLYDEASRNVLFAKGQQWRVLEYFTLLAVALVAIGIAMPYAQNVARFIAGFLVFSGAFSLAVLLVLQVWQYNEQAKMAYLTGDFSNFARAARKRKPSLAGDIHRYFILATMMLYVVVLDVVVVRLLVDIGH